MMMSINSRISAAGRATPLAVAGLTARVSALESDLGIAQVSHPGRGCGHLLVTYEGGGTACQCVL